MTALINTLTRRKVPFVPADPARVTMYADRRSIHTRIGSARPLVEFDVLFRLLRRQYGEHADLCAKLHRLRRQDHRRRQRVRQTISATTEKFTRIYEEDAAALGVLQPTLTPSPSS